MGRCMGNADQVDWKENVEALRVWSIVGVMECDDRGNIVFVNRRLADMLGYSTEEAKGKSFSDMVDEQGSKAAISWLEQARQGVVEQTELYLRRKDGNRLWAMVAGMPSGVFPARSTGVRVEVIDATPLRGRGAEVLRICESMLLALEDTSSEPRELENHPTGLKVPYTEADYEKAVALRALEKICDIAGADLGCYLKYELATSNIIISGCTGLTEIMGTHLQEAVDMGIIPSCLLPLANPWVTTCTYVPDLHAFSIRAKMDRNLRSAYWMPLNRGRNYFGAYALFSSRIEGFTREQRILATTLSSSVSIAMDNARLLRELQRASEILSLTQQQLFRVQKMETVGRLAGGVSHELNNQLAVIKGYTDIGLRDSTDNEGFVRVLLPIRRAAERAAGLTRQLLLFSRKQPQNKMRLDINLVITEELAMIGGLIGENICVELALSPNLWPVSADADNIGNVITNLVLNARDAMPHGGTLTIKSENVRIDESMCRQCPGEAKIGRFVCLTLADTGEGMDDQVRSRLFEPFFTTKEPGKGTGLGLSVALSTIKAHGGWIDVRSQAGKGSTFKIFLPAQELKDIDGEASAGGEGGPAGSIHLENLEAIILKKEDE